MPDEYELSRRKVLAGLGTIGVAGAGAGFGTSAYFSDQETFENNTLQAGQLDMKVGWEEHYSDWSDDEGEGLQGDVMMEAGPGGTAGSTVDSTRVGLPSNVAALISVEDDDDAMQFLDNTQVDAYPDGYDSDDYPTGSSITCGDTLLTDDADTPIIDLEDVKPGDFGEVTFSFALCDNPGYVWAGAFLEDASENGVVEPERKDPDEEDGVVELLDEIQVAVWLDDGDNYQDCGEQPLTVGSLREVVTGDAPNIENNGLRLDGRNEPVLGTATELTAYGVNRFDIDGDGNLGADVELVDDPVDSGKVAKATSGGEATTDYVTTAVCVPQDPTIEEAATNGLTYEYYEGEQNENAAPDEAIVLVRDDNDVLRVFSRTWNDGDGASSSWTTRNVGTELKDNFSPNSDRNWLEVNDDGTTDTVGTAVTDDGAVSGSSTVLAMAAGRGNTDPNASSVLEVYYRDPAYDETAIGPFPTSCFRGDGTVYNGVFAWWLPVDHANEIQTDSATFSLGLYTEQCRHNDGDGPAFDTEDDNDGNTAQ